MAARFSVEHNDVTKFPSDLLLLKHASGFHGVDLAVAKLVMNAGVCAEVDISPRPGECAIVPSHGVMAPSQVMFLGTPPLRDFSYGQMRYFARRAITLIAERGISVKRLTTTVHGVNYGLDASEALQNLVGGFQEGLTHCRNCRIDEIVFVEKKERTVRILKAELESLRRAEGTAPGGPGPDRGDSSAARGTENRRLSGTQPGISQTEGQLGTTAEPPVAAKKHVFVAMPFSEEFQDIYEFGIYGPIRSCGFICERVDEATFTGDILQRIIQRIATAEFVVAELTGARANVYLEVGYAWGKGIPVITLAREGEKLHFDVSTHRCVFYRTIGQLARELEKLVRGVYDCRRQP